MVAERVFMKEVVPAPTYASPRLDVKSYLNDLLKKHKHIRHIWIIILSREVVDTVKRLRDALKDPST